MSDFEKAKQFFIAGLQALEVNNFQAAETHFAQSLAILPDRVSTLNNLAAVKIRLENFAAAEALARKAVALDEKSAEAWSSLGTALAKLDRHEEALQAHSRAIDANSANAKAWLNKALCLLEMERYAAALPACEQALDLNPVQYEALFTKSRILKGLNRLAEAKIIYQESIEARVAATLTLTTERRAGQKAEVLVVSQNPMFTPELKSFEDLHLTVNFPGQLAHQLNDDFHFTYIFRDDAVRVAGTNKIPTPQLVINNNANGEALLAGGELAELAAAFDRFSVPVVNHPRQVVQTTRDATAKLLADIPGVQIPRTERFSTVGINREDLVREIETRFDYPLITRTLTAQEGKGMTKVDSREHLLRVLATDFPETFFVTAFVDSRNGSPFYRKIRAAVVRDETIFMRVDFDTNWNVHGRKSEERAAFYLGNPNLLAQEKLICANPEKELGAAAVQSLQAISTRIPLDVFGVDFDVDAAGRLVFYEANATMNLYSTANEKVPYPPESEARLKAAMQNCFSSLIARR
jgi:tetratricopeptide (TPR) repeat protein